MKAYFIILIFFMTSCGKDFLEYKYDVSLTTPSKLSDYRGMLDNSLSLFNVSGAYQFSQLGSDEFYLMTDQWRSINNVLERNAYIFSDDVYGLIENSDDWNLNYQRIMVCNMVLDGLKKIGLNETNQQEAKEIEGTALFFRAFNYYQLAQVFCEPYLSSRAEQVLGLPLRLEADVTLKSYRSSLAETYRLIVTDLKEATLLLPDVVPTKLRPSSFAAKALLSRVFLLMDDYNSAFEYVDDVLSKKQDMMLDFNSLNSSIRYPFTADYGQSNPEVIFFQTTSALLAHSRARMQIDNELYQLYEDDDLRKRVYFEPGTINNIYYRGSLSGGAAVFVGLSISELLLVRAEIYARRQDITNTLEDINHLRKFRMSNYVKLIPTDVGEDPLSYVLDERRRELAFRALRWEDLRRLNKEAKYAKVITRNIDNNTYTLIPNNSKYTYLLPPNVIRLSGMEQNKR